MAGISEKELLCKLCQKNQAITKVYSVEVCKSCLDQVNILIQELARIIGTEFGTTVVRRIREIGEEVNRIGGMNLMIDVSMKSSEINPRVRAFLGKYWDGIGEWVD
jgi:hypothetical protein